MRACRRKSLTSWLAAILLGFMAGGQTVAYAQGRTGDQTQAQQALLRGNQAYNAKRYREAERHFMQAIGYDSSLTDAFEKLSAIYYQRSRHSSAVALLRRGLSANRGNAALSAWLGLHLLKLRITAEAIRRLQFAVKKNHKLFLAQIKLGGYYMRNRRWSRAVHAFWNFLKFRDRKASRVDPAVNLMLGIAYLRLKRYPQAQSRFKRALILRPKYVKARLGLAEVYVMRGYCPQALNVFKKYRKLQGRMPRLVYLEAVCFHRMRWKARALATVGRFLSRKPRSAEGHILKGDVHFFHREYGSALAAYKKATRVDPKSMQAVLKYGQALMARRRYREATRVLEMARSRGRTGPAVLASLGNCYLRLKRVSDAVKVLLQLTRQYPRNVSGRALLGDALIIRKDINGAVVQYRKALKFSRNKNSRARNGLIVALNRIAGKRYRGGNPGGALKALSEAYKLNSRKLVTNRNLGLVYLSAGRRGAALTHLLVALKKVPRDFVVNRLLGRLYLEQKRYTAARGHYLKARQAAYRLAANLRGEVQLELGIMLARTGEPDQAIEQFKEAAANTVADKPLNRLARVTLVDALTRRGQKLLETDKADKAVSDLELARDNVKGLGEKKALIVQFLLAMAYLDAGKWNAANRAFRLLKGKGALGKVLRPPYDRLGLRFFSTYASYRQGRYGQAATVMKKMARRVKGKLKSKIKDIVRSCYELMGTMHLRAGRVKVALGNLKTASRYGRTRETAHNLALAMYKKGKTRKAVRVWQRGAMPPQALCNLGAHYDNSGNPRMAYQFYKKCLARGGGGAAIKKRLRVKERIFGFK